MSDQQELRQRREALAQAVNRHDLEAVHSFIHPSFVGKTKRGFSVGYQDIVRMVEPLLAPEKEYQETVEIEEIEASGDSAKLVTRRSERGRFYDSERVGLLKGLGIMCLIGAIYSAMRAQEWDFENISTVGIWAVGCVAFLGSAYFMRRSRQRTVRYQETWRTVDGRWLLVEEQEL